MVFNDFNNIFAWLSPRAFIQFSELLFITAMDMEIDSKYGKWLISPDKRKDNYTHEAKREGLFDLSIDKNIKFVLQII